MSARARQWAKRQRAGGLAAKAVLLLLADHANDAGEAWPSTRTLAEEADADAKSVRRQLDKLEARGLIHKRPGDRVRPNLYVLALEVEVTERATRAATGSSPVGSDRPHHRGVTPPSPWGQPDPTQVGSLSPHGWGQDVPEVGSDRPHNQQRTKDTTLDDVHTRARDRAEEAHHELASRAVAVAIGTSRPHAVREALRRRAVMLLEDGALGVDLAAGLADWRATPNARIPWLDHKVADAASRREAAERPPQPRASTTDERVQACLDRAALYEEALAAGCATPAEQFAYAATRRGQTPAPPGPLVQAELAEVITLPRAGAVL